MNRQDTIVALSSGGGAAGVGVVRLSGDKAGEVLCALTGRGLPLARRAGLVTLRAPLDGRVLDESLVLWFPGPGSFTGEDVVELHLHGGTAVVDGVLSCVCLFEGVRLAEPGEFTRRAVQFGRLDAIRAEGLGDLIAAETEGQRGQALRQMGGSLSSCLETWRQRLVTLLAHFEADIEFGEEDLPGGLSVAIREGFAALRNEIGAVLAAPRYGEKVREGFLVSILGPPNVGKSSLLNRLAGMDVAIVSERAGTTRDVVETRLVLAGVPVTFADTAGLWAGGDDIEREGMRRARAHGERSDLRLVVFDGSDPDGLAGVGGLLGPGSVGVANKSDLVAGRPAWDEVGDGVVSVSAKDGTGLDVLQDRVVAALGCERPKSDGVVLTRARHRQALEACHECLGRVLTADLSEMAAEDGRLAIRELGRVLGVVDVEDLLDVIFRDFCIGK